MTVPGECFRQMPVAAGNGPVRDHGGGVMAMLILAAIDPHGPCPPYSVPMNSSAAPLSRAEASASRRTRLASAASSSNSTTISPTWP